MSNAAITRLATNAILAKLDDDLGTVPVGDGIAPDGAGSIYAVLDVMSGTVTDPLVRDDRWVKHVVQVRSVALDREGAQWLQDRVRTSLLARDLTVTGATVMRVELEVSNVVTRDDDADPTSLFVVSDRYAFHLDTRG